MKEWFGEHSLIIMLTIAAVFTFVWLRLNRARLGISAPAAAVLSILHVAAGVLCVKAFAFLESFGKAAPGAMSLFGGVFFLPLLYFIGARLFKRKISDVFDVFGICMVFTLFCARINCIISGCCLGRPVHGADSLRWPTREAELIYYVLFLILMIPRVKKGVSGGKIYPLYMVSYGIVRAILEVFRESSSAGFFHVAHIWAFISLALGVSIYAEIVKQHKSGRPGRSSH